MPEQDNSKIESTTTEFLIKIVEGLGKRPAYLLIFGICALFIMVGSVVGVYGIISDKPAQQYASVVSFAIALIFAYLTIKIVEAPAPKSVGREILVTTGDNKFDEILTQMYQGLSKALKKAQIIDSIFFRDEIIAECHNFESSIEAWAAGKIITNRDKYCEILLRIYENAKNSVFSTSIQDYQSVWEKSALGEKIIEAHKKSSATVTRVFIFDKRSNVTSEKIEIMKKQDIIDKIEVRLYFEEDKTVAFPEGVSKDFTIVDGGEAIGSTFSLFGKNEFVATWYFKDENQKQKFLSTSYSLVNRSVSFSNFYKQWKKEESK